MCGKFNYQSRDDFTTLDLQETSSVAEFVGSFALATSSACMDDVTEMKTCEFVSDDHVRTILKITEISGQFLKLIL